MNGAAMILDPVGVANLDEVNLSYMVESGVIFPDFTWLLCILKADGVCKYFICLKHLPRCQSRAGIRPAKITDCWEPNWGPICDNFPVRVRDILITVSL